MSATSRAGARRAAGWELAACLAVRRVCESMATFTVEDVWRCMRADSSPPDRRSMGWVLCSAQREGLCVSEPMRRRSTKRIRHNGLTTQWRSLMTHEDKKSHEKAADVQPSIRTKGPAFALYPPVTIAEAAEVRALDEALGQGSAERGAVIDARISEISGQVSAIARLTRSALGALKKYAQVERENKKLKLQSAVRFVRSTLEKSEGLTMGGSKAKKSPR